MKKIILLFSLSSLLGLYAQASTINDINQKTLSINIKNEMSKNLSNFHYTGKDMNVSELDSNITVLKDTKVIC